MNPFTRNESTSTISGDQFKNTQVWDQVVYSFCMSVPIRRHRRRFRTYTDCFVAKSAVDWLHGHLTESQHFNQIEVSRFQAVQLLRKFHKCDIIVRVDGKDNLDHEFDDNGDLYRLSQAASRKLPVMKPHDEENRIYPLSNRLTSNSLAVHNQSLNSQCCTRPCNPPATVRTSRAVKRSFSNVSSLRPLESPQFNCWVNEGFNDSMSDERTPLKSMNQSIVQLHPNPSNVSNSSRTSFRPESPANIFW